MNQLNHGWKILRRYPSVGVSLLIILSLLAFSIYARVRMPLSKAIELWNGPAAVWQDNPWNAPPAWTNIFRANDWPESIVLNTENLEATREQIGESVWRETKLLTFDYPYAITPEDVFLSYELSYGGKIPMLTLTWIKPDGSEIRLIHVTAHGGKSRLEIDPSEAFGESATSDEGDTQAAAKGRYALRIEAMLFDEERFTVDGELFIRGRVFGLAGTDSLRRDLMICLTWGTPIALGVGLLAALVTTMFGFIVAAISAWYGGWIDTAIQRLTDASMMMPLIPILAIVATFYSNRLIVLLAFIIGLNLLSGPLKVYRAMFLQVVQSQYIEGARAYGASNARIIFRYLIPHMIPVALPRIIIGVPFFVFLEASLALLGVSDPRIPTWGKLLSSARSNMYFGYYHTVLEPAVLLLLTGIAFAMLGSVLDRIFNPKLRDT